MGSLNDIALVFGLTIWLMIIIFGFIILIYIPYIVGRWKAFSKSGQPGWAAIIPIYSTYVFCRVAGKSNGWFFALMGLSVVALSFQKVTGVSSFIGRLVFIDNAWVLVVFLYLSVLVAMIYILTTVSFAAAFRKSGWFTVGLIFLPMIFYPILGIGESRYKGAPAQIMFGDLFRDVFLNLFRKKLRALLTMTGVIIGSFLVVLILSLSHGLSEFLDQQVRAVWDERMIKVRLKKGGAPEKMAKGLFGGLGEPPQEVKKENEEEIPGAFKFRHIPHESIEKLRKIDGVMEVQPEIWVMPRSMQVKGDGREFDAIVRPWIMAGPDMLAYGEDFSSDNAKECVVSEAYLVALGYDDPNQLIGKTIKIRVQEDAYIAMAGGGQMDLKFLDRIRDIAQLMRNPPEDPELAMFTTFVLLRDLANSSEIQALSTKPGKAKEFEAKVVGISKKGLLTNIIYLPKELIAEMGRVFLRNPDMYKMDKSGKFGIEGLVQVRDAKEIPRIKKEIRKLDMKATTLEDVIGFIHGLFAALAAILMVFVMIAGVVAFFSIVNTLFMAITERKREIGVLQAIGATRGYIAALFAAEAGAIGLLGGLIGFVFGLLLCWIGNIYAAGKWGNILGVSDLFVTPLWLLPLMLLATTLVGALAGVYPAWRASRLDPVVALRYE